MIRPEDDLFHRRNDDPHWNESAWFTFNVPDRTTAGMVYFYHRPNMNLTAGGPVLWDGQGEEIYDCKFWNWDAGPGQPLPAGAEAFDFRLRSGLAVETIKLQHAYRITYEGKGCELDLTWEGFLDPFETKSLEPEAPDPGITGWLDKGGTRGYELGHYEHFGRMTGTVVIEGDRLDVDCTSVRDHTWGPRTLDTWKVSSYPWAIGSADHSFLTWTVSDLDQDSDPIADTVRRVMYGWYVKDGVIGEMVSGETRILERGDDGRPLFETLDAVDHLGRTLHAEGRAVSTLKFTGYNDFFNWWSLASWEFDGRQAWGELQEVYPFRVSRRFQRGLRAGGR